MCTDVHISCTGYSLVSTKISQGVVRRTRYCGELPLRREHDSRGNAKRSKAFEAFTLRTTMKLQYVCAARGSGFVKTSLLFSDDFTLR